MKIARDRCSHRPTMRASITVARGPVPRDLSINAAWRGTGPRPTVRGPFCEEDGPPTVARGPVPRDLSIYAAWRGTGPRPTVGGVFLNVARGPVPRERWDARTMARDRPSPYVKEAAFFSS